MKHNPNACKLAVCLALVLVLTSCSNFLSPVKAFLDEYTNTAAVEDVAYSRSVPQDGTGVTCLPANEACTISFLLRNPQGYELQPSAVLVSGNPLSPADYSLALAADKQSVQLEFTQTFLAAHDMGGDISVTLALFEPATGRNFPPYTLQLKANTPPPVPQGGCIMANASNHYVVCFNLDLGTIHGDLKSIEVNGYSSTVTSSVGPASLSFVNPSFSATNPGSLVPLGARPSFTAGSGTIVPVYLVTNELVNVNNNEYRITITDTAGFSTTYSLWTLSDFLGPVKVTNLIGTELDDGGAIPQDAGLTTGTVLIKAPTETDQGAPVSDVTVYYQLYRDASYTILHSSGSFTGTQTAVAVPPVLVYIKAWAQKNGYSDSLAKQMSVRATAVRLSVNETNVSGIYWGTNDYPYSSIASAIAQLSLVGNSENTMYVLSDITAEVNINTPGLVLTIEGNNHTLDGKNAHRCLKHESGTITVKNTSFKNGFVSAQSGGGIFVTGGSTTLTLITCTIENNRILPGSNAKGAGIAIQSGATVVMDNCTVSTNQFVNGAGSSFGGGISLDGSSIATSLTMMNACKVNGNIAGQNSASYGSGGGIYATGSAAQLTLTNCTIENNTAGASYSGMGGGLAIVGGVTAVLENVTVSGNSAIKTGSPSNEGLGGGIYCSGSSLTINTNSTVTVKDNWASNGSTIGNGGGLYLLTTTIINNGVLNVEKNVGSKGYEGKGGGLYLTGNAGLNLINATINLNTASEAYVGRGGGVYIENSTQLISSCTISNNKGSNFSISDSAPGFGGGIYIVSTSDTKIQNCIIEFNQAANKGVGWGGGIYNLGGEGIVLSLGTIVQGNVATSSGTQPGYGGGIASGGGQLSVYDSSISNNTANINFNGSGGGLFLGEGNYTMGGTITVQNNIATQGAGAGKGGGIYIDTGGAVVVFFSGGLVTGNTAGGTSPQGNGIWAGNTFSMQGNASATADNDVYLVTGEHINISLTLTSAIAAMLTPQQFQAWTQVLAGNLTGANISKFQLSQPNWMIDISGMLQPN